MQHYIARFVLSRKRKQPHLGSRSTDDCHIPCNLPVFSTGAFLRKPREGERMRLKTLFLVAFWMLGSSCSSTTEPEERDARFLAYSLTGVDGQAVPGPLSSLPGLLIWEGEGGAKLTVWEGQVVCNDDGTAEESYGFRLSVGGSAVWEPIIVELDLTCEFADPGLVTFRNPATGEVLDGTLQEGFEGCPALAKGIPSPQSLRRGYRPSMSQAELPAELEFSGPLNGDFRQTTCSGMWAF